MSLSMALDIPNLANTPPRYSLRPRSAVEHNARISLYKLAPEIRAHIYEYVFADSYVILVPKDEYYCGNKNIYRAQVMYASRLLYQESRVMYYAITRYQIGFGEFRNRVPPQIAPLVRYLEVHELPKDSRCLDGLPNLKYVSSRQTWYPTSIRRERPSPRTDSERDSPRRSEST